ncbi:sushi, von Willebrand factor type A, EGF and pentraxin domain-containing protein 1-like [Ruditapes philippinarum]|uniref:sushi, von Willebrand factor type A, EGF and pentraxin domain-containing protein 1-like n=1 Tax=Ruditapes philippinarum TaxID=129788 RepID=UPI00295AD5A7|nr:sushi, von Willebrand factor type A, EGF and pentraxin domain-containing protein 1-like [Ruditapes philippinarum]
MEFLFRIYMFYIILHGINAIACSSNADCPNGSNMTCDLQNFHCIYACSSDADCPQGNNMTCNLQKFHCINSCGSDADCPKVNNFTCSSVNECECPSNYFLYHNYCLYDCGDPPVFEVNGINLNYTLHYANGFEDYLVFYNCPGGYTTQWDYIGVCREGGWTAYYFYDGFREVWSDVCSRGCGNLPAITNGNMTLDCTTTVGSTATVYCSDGYSGNASSITCLDTGQWEVANCTLKDCGDVPTISNGTIHLKEIGNTTYGALAEVVCENGYNETLDFIECRDTGEWDAVGCSLVDCGILPPIDNGSIVLIEDGNSSFGALAEVTCYIGHSATLETIMCRNTGKWDNTSCEVINCGDVPIVIKGSVTLLEEHNTTYSALANVSCDTGYNSSIGIIQCLETGQWQTTECQLLDCETVPVIANGQITLKQDGNTTYAAIANVSCSTGYNATVDVILCLDTGEWDNATCKLIDCSAAPKVANGNVALLGEENTTYGALAEITCETGYNSSVQTIQCRDTGVWDTATCDLIDCGDVPTIPNGTIHLKEERNTTYRALAEVVCENGYNETLDFIECRYTGEWDAVGCSLIDCGMPLLIDNGSITLIEDGNSSFGALAEVTCYIGHSATLETIMCRNTGKWDNTSCESINCGDVPTVIKGSVTLLEEHNTTYSALANVSCHTGYNASIGIIQCLETGQWQTTECQLLDCESVPVVLNGEVALIEADNTTYGQLAEVTCNKGYNSTSGKIKCLETGKWETTQCEILNCEAVPVIANGQVTLTQDGNTTYGAIANVSCSIGYNATVDIILCLDTGEWDNATCNLIDCETVPVIANGQITLKQDGNTTYGAIANVSCSTGYNATVDVILCLDTGEWDNATCKLIDCSAAPKVANGNVALLGEENTTYGALAEITCETGYNSSVQTIQCRDTGVWDTATCDLIDCGDVPTIPNGTIHLKEERNTTYRALAEVVCENGYNETLDFIECRYTGEWDAVGCSLIDCGMPLLIDNGSITLIEDGNSSFGALAEVTCYIGHSATLETIMCRNTGKWDNTSCESINCGDVPTVIKGYVTLLEEHNTTYSALANVSCHTGYNASIGIIQCLETGQWQTTECQLLDCESVPVVLKGEVALIEADNTTYGQLAEVTCNKGYNSTSGTIKCLETGKWETTQCEILNCEAVPVIANGQVTLTQNGNTTYGAIANVSCSTGHNATVDTILCLDTGEWDNATCNLIDCETVPVIANGQITLKQDGNTTYGAIANGSCSTGYNATVDVILCLDTGEWDNATCKLIDCSAAPKVANGNVALLGEENTTYGALAKITCETGYNSSVQTIQCRDTGVWETATCDLIVCEPSPTIENGKVYLQEESNYSFGAIARIDCETGYIASIIAIQCRENGTWDTAICSIIDCGRLDDPMNGNINTSNGTTYGSTATYTCDEGLDIIGDVTRICDSNGKWSNTKPDCLLKGAKRCPDNTDERGTVWKAIAGGRNRSNACQTNFTGTVNRQCGIDGFWKFPQYLCIRESVKKVINTIDLLNEDTSHQDVLNALQGLKDVTTQAENIVEQDKLTDFEVSRLITSTETVAVLLSSSPNLINNQLTDVFTETISNLIDVKNSGSWNAITQNSSEVAKKMLASVDTLGNAMAIRVNSTGNSLPAVVKPNIALHVKAVSSNNFVFPGSDAVQETSSDNWLRATDSQIKFNPASFGGTSQQPVVSAAIYKDISIIMPDKSDNEQLNGQVLSFSTLPPLNGTFDPPITMKFELTNEQLTSATCSFWETGKSGSGAWANEGCTGRSISENLTECECNHTTNFAVILSLQDCGGLGSLGNGEIDNSAGTTYKATANFRCNKGYNINGANTSMCLYNGSWSAPVPSCFIKDCGILSNPSNGNVSTPKGTTFENKADYSCDNGYILNGTETRLCLLTGSWSSTAPTCVKEVQTPKTCKENVDSRGLTWQETISGNTRNELCQSGFTGSRSRTCGAGGVWNLPQYDCVRKSIVKIIETVSVPIQFYS